MSRIRTVKPELSLHEGLFDLEQETRLPIRFAWAMLPTICDREGRFKWKPRRLGVRLLPYDECDFSRVLDAFVTRGFLVRYRVNDEWFGWVPTFRKHQSVNPRETESELPGLEEADEVINYNNQEDADASTQGIARVADASPADEPDPDDPIAATLPLVDGSDHPIQQSQVAAWAAAYPAVQVPQALLRMRAWCEANPQRRKTRRGIDRAVVAWLSRDQDRGGGGPPANGGGRANGAVSNAGAAEEAKRRFRERQQPEEDRRYAGE